MVVTALHDLPVVCAPQELNVFSAPPNTTCGEYMQPFFANGGPGYLVNNNATTDCQYCAFKVGDEFYEALGLSFDNRWRDLGIYIAFIGSNLIILFVAVSLGSRLGSCLIGADYICRAASSTLTNGKRSTSPALATVDNVLVEDGNSRHHILKHTLILDKR
jgi:hypothetical protein